MNNDKIRDNQKRDKNYIVLTTSPSPHYKTLVYVNECKMIVHPQKKTKIWMSRCKYILDSEKINIMEIVEMIAKRDAYIYISGIKRFDNVTKKHLKIIENNRTLFGIIN